MELFCSNFKKFLIFQGTETLKKIPYIFGKWNFLAPLLGFSYILGNGKFLYFRKQKPRKNSLYFRRNFQSPEKPKFFIFFQKKL